MFFTRAASRKSSPRVTKADNTRKRKLFFESLEDRRLLALIAYTSGHTLDAGQLAAVGLTVTPNVNGFSADDAGFASALASGAQAVVIGEGVGGGGGLSPVTMANIASYASSGGNVIVLGSHGGQASFLNSVFGFSTATAGSQSSGELITKVAGDGPATLAANSATEYITGAPGLVTYIGNGGATVAFNTSFGAGVVSYLGWDFCCGGTSAQDLDWYTVLERDVNLSIRLDSVDPSPRTQSVDSVQVHFIRDVDPLTFDYNDITLTRNAGPNLINPSVVVTQLTPRDFTISGLAPLTGAVGTYKLTVSGAAINDSLSTPISGQGSTAWDLDTTFVVPLKAKEPLGSLIYYNVETRGLPAATDVQALTIDLDAGQKFSVVITPTSTLRPSVNITNPASASIGSMTAAGPGQEVVFRNLTASAAGTYQISVATAGGTTGKFALEVYLNADVEVEQHGGPSNDTLGTAQDINANFSTLTQGGALRAAVVGHAGRGFYDVDRNSGLLRQIDVNTGATLGSISMTVAGNPVTGAFSIAVDPTTNVVYALVSYSGVNTALVTLNVVTGVGTAIADVNASGQRFTDFAFDSAGTLYGLTGDSGANSNSLFAIDKTNGARTLLVALTNYGSGTGESLAFNPDTGLLYRFQAGVFDSIDPNNSFAIANIPVSGSNPYQAQALTYVGGGQFRLSRFAQLYSLTTTGTATFVGNLESTSSRIHGLSLIGGDIVDVYSFNLTANQTTTLATQRDSTVELLNSVGVVLATGIPASNVSSIISNFTASATDVYYARVTRPFGVGEYSLIVTKNAAFDTENNNSISTAQNIGNVNVALGSVEQGLLLGADDGDVHLLSIDPATGVATILASGVGGGSGYNDLARNPVTGVLFGSQARNNSGLYQLSTSPFTETLIGFMGGNVRGLAWSPNGAILYGYRDSVLGTINPGTAAFTPIADSGIGFIGGMAFQPGTGVLFAVTNVRGVQGLYTINTTTAAATFIGNPGSNDYNSLTFLADGTLLGGIGRAASNPGDLMRINPATGAATLVGHTIPSGFQNLTGLAQIPAEGDYYKFPITAGAQIQWSTLTPGDGPFEFPNSLDPALELYDPSGVLVASNDNGALDGRNAILTYTALATGNYTVHVVGAGSTNGEYVLTREPTGSLDAVTTGGALTVTDISPGGKDNDLLVRVVGANLVITDANEQFTPTSAAATGGTLSNGDRTLTIPLVNITSTASVLTMGGNDLITVDYAGGPFGKALVIRGGTPSTLPGDKLVINNPSTAFPFVVDTNGGMVDASNDPTLRFSEIERVSMLDTTARDLSFGQFYARGTSAAEFIQFISASQVDPNFRLRIGNVYYPRNNGNYGPYATVTAAPMVEVFGRGGNDTISMYNTRLNGALFGEGGDDTLTGGYGNDLIVGGSGHDKINGGTVGGHDEIWGDDFNPGVDNPAVASQAVLVGNDTINTFAGNDTVYGQGGVDTINTGGGADYINGGPGNDTLDGQAGNDRVYGGTGNDLVVGADGNDLLAGNDGTDTLYGRLGNDILIGGDGVDTLNGNEGGDALVGDDSNNSGNSNSLAKSDTADAALLALLNAWGPSPVLSSLGVGFGSSGDDSDLDTLWGGSEADAFFSIALDLKADRVVGTDLN
ncbi:MAG: beta strand repeat-containing protein [Pirellulaceae bacterium]